MKEEILVQLEDFRKDIATYSIQDDVELEQFRIQYLGSKNRLKSLFSLMKDVPADERKDFGQKLNDLKQLAETRYQQSKDELGDKEHSSADDQDWTLPGRPFHRGARHPVQLTLDRIIRIFHRIGFTIAEEREIEDDWHNFTAMNTPENHPARDMQDTYYIAGRPDHVLRTHTSSVQARVMTTSQPPIRIIAPGRVYRNETISARSHCQFHQVEGLYIDEGVSFADMKQTLLYYAQAMYGTDVRIRLRPSYFPFTEPSAEMDVHWGLETELDHRITKGTGWLEVMGCGMVDPAVLTNCGIDADRYSGFAFGMGIERQAMFTYKIPDIRMLFENNVRFLEQFIDAI